MTHHANRRPQELPNGKSQVVGNATECALLNLSAALGGSNAATHTRSDFLPFSSESKTSRAIATTPEGKTVFFVTGAPERILAW